MEVGVRRHRMHVLEQGSGVPILWIHGFPLSSEAFRPQLGMLGVRHIVPDLPGFGLSEEPSPETRLTIDNYASILVELLDDLSIPRVVAAGLSMGGYIALSMIRRHHDRIGGLILIDTRAEPDSTEARQSRLETIEQVEREGTGPLIASMLPRLITGLDENVLQHAENIMRTASRRGIIEASRAMADRPDATPELSSISVPTLVIVGERDEITPEANARKMADEIPGAELIVIPGAAHLSNLDNPAEFNAAVRHFLDTHRGVLPEERT